MMKTGEAVQQGTEREAGCAKAPYAGPARYYHGTTLSNQPETPPQTAAKQRIQHH